MSVELDLMEGSLGVIRKLNFLIVRGIRYNFGDFWRVRVVLRERVEVKEVELGYSVSFMLFFFFIFVGKLVRG